MIAERLRVRAADGAQLDVFVTRSIGTPAHAPIVIVCHGFIQNRLAFEVPHAHGTRSLLAHLRSLGVCVAAVELRGRTAGGTGESANTAAGLHEYTDVDAPAVIEALTLRHHRAIAWLGHSMGGLVGALLPEPARDRLSALVTIGTPLFAGRPSLHLFRNRSTAAVIRASRAAHARGLPFHGRRWSLGLHAMRRVLDVPAVPMPVRLWAPGSLTQQALSFTLKRSFADDSFAAFADLLELVVTDGARAGLVDAGARIAAFSRPALVVTGDVDDLAPRAGARPLYERLGERSHERAPKDYLEVGAGHIDLLIGAAAPALVWAPIAAFLRRHLALPA